MITDCDEYFNVLKKGIDDFFAEKNAKTLEEKKQLFRISKDCGYFPLYLDFMHLKNEIFAHMQLTDIYKTQRNIYKFYFDDYCYCGKCMFGPNIELRIIGEVCDKCIKDDTELHTKLDNLRENPTLIQKQELLNVCEMMSKHFITNKHIHDKLPE